MGRSHSVLSALLWVQLLFVSSCPFVQAAAPKFVAPQTFRGINHFPTHTLDLFRETKLECQLDAAKSECM